MDNGSKKCSSLRTSLDSSCQQNGAEPTNSPHNTLRNSKSEQCIRDISVVFNRYSFVGSGDDENSDTSTEVSFGTDLSKFMRCSLSGTSYDIARLVHYIFKDSYRVARLKTKSWYVHDGMKWKPTEVGPYYELSTSIAQLFDTYLQIHTSNKTEHVEEESNKDSSNEEKERQKKIEAINKIISKLKNVNTKEMICKECVYLFYDPDFLTKLDTSTNIICFQNGVLDIEHNDFRQGNSEDMISLHIDMNFVPPKVQKDHNELAKVIEQFQEFRNKVVNKRKNRYIFSTT